MNFRVFSFFAISTAGLLAGCQDHKPAIETFGQLDSAAIGADTGMQVNMDRSYEYLRTFAEGDSVAYDFLAYDKPKGSSNPEWESKFILIRRSHSRQDTVVKAGRASIVRSSWMSDIDGNGRREFFFYESPVIADKGPVTLYAYESNGPKQMSRITAILKNEDAHYRGRDTFFLSDDRIIRLTPYFSSTHDSTAAGMMRQRYKLSGGKLILESESLQ